MDINAPQSFTLEIKQYALILWRWVWLLIVFAVLGGGLTYYLSIRQPKIYSASATLLIDQPQTATDYASILTNERIAQTYSQMMIQPTTLEGVIQQLDLDLSVGKLESAIQVKVIPETRLMEITIEDTDPVRAAQIVNTTVDVFDIRITEMQASRYQETKNSLEAQMMSMDQQIESTNQALQTLRSIPVFDTQLEVLQVQLETYSEIYKGLLKQVVELEAQPPEDSQLIDLTEESVANESPVDQQIAIIEATIIDLTEQIKALGWLRDGEYDLLTTRLSVYNNLYKQLVQDLVFSGEEFAMEDGLITMDHPPNIETLSAQMELTGQRIQELTAEINALGGSTDGEVERDRLESNLALYRQTYANLVQSYEQVRLAEIQNTSRVDLIQPATTPHTPIRPNVMQNTMLGLMVGLVGGIGVAFIIEMLDDTVKGPGDVTRHLKLPVLGYIARIDENTQYPITLEKPRSPLSEAFRSLRTNIQFTSVDHPLLSIMVTSPTPVDGKSTVIANLGVVLGQGKYKVTIVDADLRLPDQHKIFNLSNRYGLTDALINPEFSLNGSLQKTAVENLSILTTGDLPPNPSELVGSDKMMELIRELEARKDLVIIDTPPVMAVTDPVILSTRVDGVLLVLRCGITKLAAAIQTVTQLRQVGAKILGVVLNDVDNKGTRYYNYYSGYYHYGNYSKGSSNGKNRTSKTRRRIPNNSKSMLPKDE